MRVSKRYHRLYRSTPSIFTIGFSSAAKTWLPVHPNYVELNLLAQQQAKRSHYKVYKSLVALRKLPVLRRGRFNIETLSRAVFAFKR